MTGNDKMWRILVVDDSPPTVEMIERNLRAAGYRVLTATGAEEAIRILEEHPVDLVVTDLKMPKVSGLELIRHVRENFPLTEVMMITGYATVDGAVEAVKTGAEAYLAKPFTDEELLDAVATALDKLRLRRAGRPGAHAIRRESYGLVGESPAMLRVCEQIVRTAASSATVLLTGESGTGKELVARAIHYSSAQAAAPFVAVNCAGIPEGLLESELFGHVRGAFTGATTTRAGFFQTADGGTIFLDEIGDTSPTMQARLLRVLQEHEVCMVGSSRPQKVDIRVVAATNRDLLELTRKKGFREDLYYRLSVLTITLPPLRERGDDVLLLATHFADQFSKAQGRETPRFAERALAVLRGYDWPGNVRELQNVVQRLVVMTDGPVIEVTDLPELMRFSALRNAASTRTLAEIEQEYVRVVLAGTDGNKTRAAQILGISRKTLREKLRKPQ